MLKKFISILLFLFSLSTISFSQVNFDLDFTFSKIDPEDELVSLQLLDYNDDGNDEIIAGFSNEENDEWRIVCYSLTGDTLETYSQEYQNNEYLRKAYLYKYATSNNYLITTLNSDYSVNLLLKIYNFESSALIDSCIITISGLAWFEKVYFIKPLLFNESLIIYVGTSVFYGGSVETEVSNIYKFLFNNYSLSFIESIEGCGADLRKYDSFDSLISLNKYSIWCVGAWPEEFRSYSIKLLTHEYASSVIQVYYTSGSCVCQEPTVYYDYPSNFRILTNNDNFYSDYGMIIYFRQNDSDYGIRNNFKCFCSDFSATCWTKHDTQIGSNNIISSTCVLTNLGNYFVMYFRENQLEIRDRITGNIVHNDSSSINPFTIKRTSDNELLFFVYTGNEYEVYTVNDIYLSVDDKNSNINNTYQLSNYPNPFRSETMISLNLTKDSVTNLHELTQMKIYNIKGQFVKELGIRISGCEFGEAIWDGRDENGRPVPTGIYFSNLLIDKKIQACKKIILLR